MNFLREDKCICNQLHFPAFTLFSSLTVFLSFIMLLFFTRSLSLLHLKETQLSPVPLPEQESLLLAGAAQPWPEVNLLSLLNRELGKELL